MGRVGVSLPILKRPRMRPREHDLVPARLRTVGPVGVVDLQFRPKILQEVILKRCIREMIGAPKFPTVVPFFWRGSIELTGYCWLIVDGMSKSPPLPNAKVGCATRTLFEIVQQVPLGSDIWKKVTI